MGGIIQHHTKGSGARRNRQLNCEYLNYKKTSEVTLFVWRGLPFQFTYYDSIVVFVI